MKALETGKADVIMVHAPSAEEKGVAEGWACNRTLLGSNEFYIVGPKSDPAGIRDAGSAAEAYARIAKKRAKFFSDPATGCSSSCRARRRRASGTYSSVRWHGWGSKVSFPGLWSTVPRR